VVATSYLHHGPPPGWELPSTYTVNGRGREDGPGCRRVFQFPAARLDAFDQRLARSQGKRRRGGIDARDHGTDAGVVCKHVATSYLQLREWSGGKSKTVLPELASW